uniref:NAD(+) kinase n=1 Tax=Enterobius vermicularis TaxID=51028 RepID=A0A0N4VK77_ENTVE
LQANLFRPKRVLLLAKTSRLDYERQKYSDITSDQFRAIVRSEGIEVRVVKREEYTEEAVAWADAVFTAGGDGTFLIAAAKVKDHKPVIGFNADPIRSEGHLCITRKKDLPLVANSLPGFLNGFFSLYRNEKFDPKVPVLALNDIFVGESHAARVSSYEIQIDDGAVLKQKSSGLVVSTGTGSTSWNYNINRVFEQDVSDLLRIMSSLGVPLNDTNKSFTQEICQRFNEKLVFKPQSPMLAYTIREPLVNVTYPENIKRGFASRIWIRSCCSDAHLVLDGGFSVPFNYGTEILLETHKEDALCTVMFV